MIDIKLLEDVNFYFRDKGIILTLEEILECIEIIDELNFENIKNSFEE